MVKWGSHLTAVPVGAGPRYGAVKISCHNLIPLEYGTALKRNICGVPLECRYRRLPTHHTHGLYNWKPFFGYNLLEVSLGRGVLGR